VATNLLVCRSNNRYRRSDSRADRSVDSFDAAGQRPTPRTVATNPLVCRCRGRHVGPVHPRVLAPPSGCRRLMGASPGVVAALDPRLPSVTLTGVGRGHFGRVAVARVAVGRAAVGRVAVGRVAVGRGAVGRAGVGCAGVGRCLRWASGIGIGRRRRVPPAPARSVCVRPGRRRMIGPLGRRTVLCGHASRPAGPGWGKGWPVGPDVGFRCGVVVAWGGWSGIGARRGGAGWWPVEASPFRAEALGGGRSPGSSRRDEPWAREECPFRTWLGRGCCGEWLSGSSTTPRTFCPW